MCGCKSQTLTSDDMSHLDEHMANIASRLPFHLCGPETKFERLTVVIFIDLYCTLTTYVDDL